MKILKWLLIVVGILALMVIAFLAYMGLFSELKTYEAVMGPYTIAYESFTGPYAQTGPVFNRVFRAVEAAGIEAPRGLGLYYDNPSKVKAAKLRSDLGVIIEEKELAKFEAVSSRFKVKVLPKKPSIVAEFPLRNSLSYMLGPMKGYSALTKYADQKHYKYGEPYELYDEVQQKIFFVMELVK